MELLPTFLFVLAAYIITVLAAKGVAKLWDMMTDRPQDPPQ
jgi:hypothetical protein